MAKLLSRVRAAVSSFGNDGALANVLSEMARATAARHAVEQLELRHGLGAEPARAPFAA